MGATMRRSLPLLVLWALLAGWLQPPAPAAAQERTPAPPGAEEASTLSFAQLGSREQRLRGPSDSAYLDFSLPATWALSSGAALRLDYNAFFAGAAARSFGGTLQVVLNGVTLATFLLDRPGEQAATIAISPAALTPALPDGRHSLAVILDTDEQCDSADHTSVVIRPSSALVLPHRVVAPPTDLARLPYPIAQRSFEPDAATIVVPDAPSAAELQGALTIAAGLGRMAGRGLELSLTPAGQLSDEARATTHLIVVGRPAGLPLLRAARLPAPARPSGFAAPGAQPGDGVVQLAVSPWNAGNVLLAAGGDDGAAVIKAAQAISAGALRTGARPDLALVAAVTPPPAAPALSLDQTFRDLGYDTQQLYGLGSQYAGYRFDLPPGAAVGEEAYLDLAFVHTALLDYDQSAVTVSLNDEPIASLRLDDSSTRLGAARVALPPATLRPGSNQLTFRADLLPRAVCADPRGNGLWFTIRPESSLHLPLAPADAGRSAPEADLSRYPLPFTASPNLSDLAFVVGTDDPAGWEAAALLAFDLGAQMQGSLVNLAVAYADAVPPELREGRHLLVVGQPAALPILGELGAALPAPFAPGNSLAAEPDAPVTYRLDAGAAVGYLQLAAGPWGDERAVLAVLGSSEQALAWAGAALTSPQLRGRLTGNLAVVRGEQIESRDTRPAAGASPEVPAAEAPVAEAPAGPSLLLLVGLAAGGLAALAAGSAAAVWWSRRRAARGGGAGRGPGCVTAADEPPDGTARRP